MIDIVQWLRNEVKMVFLQGEPNRLHEAADEIERLREDKAVLLETCDMWREKHWKLREALKKIADMSDEWSIHAVVQFGIIARSALKGDE
jgi:hypothetical protein